MKKGTHKLYSVVNKRGTNISGRRHWIKECALSNIKLEPTKKTLYGKVYCKKITNIYGAIHIARDFETDRMKKDRHIGTKQVRNYIKNETRKLINEAESENDII